MQRRVPLVAAFWNLGWSQAAILGCWFRGNPGWRWRWRRCACPLCVNVLRLRLLPPPPRRRHRLVKLMHVFFVTVSLKFSEFVRNFLPGRLWLFLPAQMLTYAAPEDVVPRNLVCSEFLVNKLVAEFGFQNVGLVPDSLWLVFRVNAAER